MTDTDMERLTNSTVIRKAHGNVFIAGLGVGMILVPILAKGEVQSVTVIEKNQNVIDLILPQLTKTLNGTALKLRVERGDAFTWKPIRGTKFDIVYFDIWPDRCVDNLEQVAKLHQRAKFWLNRSNPNAWMGSWFEEELKALK